MAAETTQTYTFNPAQRSVFTPGRPIPHKMGMNLPIPKEEGQEVVRPGNNAMRVETVKQPK